MDEPFKDVLLKNEEILWSGQPETKVIFSPPDIFFVPLTVFWGGIALSWGTTVITKGGPFFFCLFGIPFALIGAHIIFGRFIYKYILKKHTYYAITNKRVLIYTDLFGKGLKDQFVSQIPRINISIRSDRIGTISFGGSPFVSGMSGNSTTEFTGSGYYKYVLAFCDIQDAENVYRIINGLRQKTSLRI